MGTTVNLGQITGINIIPMDDIPAGFKRTEGSDIFVNARNYEHIRLLSAIGMIFAIGCLRELSKVKQGEELMSDDIRSNQFREAARSIVADIANTDGWQLANVEKLVAEHLYDFACHVTQNIMPNDLHDMDAGTKTQQEVLSIVPDMAELPEEKSE